MFSFHLLVLHVYRWAWLGVLPPIASTGCRTDSISSKFPALKKDWRYGFSTYERLCSWICMSTEKLMTVNLSQDVSWHRTFIDAFHSVLKRVFLFFFLTVALYSKSSLESRIILNIHIIILIQCYCLRQSCDTCLVLCCFFAEDVMTQSLTVIPLSVFS